MIRYVAFLQGINGIGQNSVSMDDIQAHFVLPGVQNVQAYVQVENVLFEAEESDEMLLRDRIEKQLFERLGFEVKVFVRMIHELKNILKNNPYDYVNSDDARKLFVTFLSATPSPSVRGALEVYSNDAEDARLMKREVYILSSNYGKTCFPLSLIEKKFGVSATTRSWNTLNKILEM